jgi:hypothetical protein
MTIPLRQPETMADQGRPPRHCLAGGLGALVLFSLVPLASRSDQPAAIASPPMVTQPPATVVKALDLDPFYHKHVFVGPLSVVGSEKVTDAALLEAAWLIRQMIGHRPDILQALADSRTRFAVMATSEFTTDLPEHSDLRPADYWDKRARGLGASRQRPAVSCGEENLLKSPGDPYSTENILIHEFGHSVHEMGLSRLDPQFDARLEATYDAALEQGLWTGTYAASNRSEYWAEGVQNWFDTNRQNDSEHNHVNTRAELQEYDPRLATLLEEVFGVGEWRYTPPQTRVELPHLLTYHTATLPPFVWPTEIVQRYEVWQRALNGDELTGNDHWSDVEPLPLAALASLRSTGGSTRTAVLIVNRRSQRVQIEWITQNGERKSYGQLGPGAHRLLDTYAGHAWLASDVEGAPLLAFFAPRKSSRALLNDVATPAADSAAPPE